MLVRCDSLIPTLLDALFLDPEHPRKGMEEALRAGIQRDGAECLLQLALVEAGKDLLERHPEALEALRALADGRALTEEARLAASGALVAMEGPGQAPAPGGEKHIVVSCMWRTEDNPAGADMPRSDLCVLADHWEEQATTKRLVASLKKRGYVVWFGENANDSDLERTKATGSIVDA